MILFIMLSAARFQKGERISMSCSTNLNSSNCWCQCYCC